MTRPPIDRASIARAMKAAARIAREGTCEDKSGKFLPPPGWKGHLVAAADTPPAPAKRRA